MARNLIASTPKTSMHALAFQGIMVYSSFPQIRDMLQRKFGDDYVLLYAMPVENQRVGQIDWYSPVQGQAQKLFDLPEEERSPIIETVGRMAQEIMQYADSLIASGDTLKVTRGHILKLSLSYPDNNALYIVGRQPVFTCWGFGPGTPGVEARDLWRLAAAAKPAAKAPDPAPVPVTSADPVPEPARESRKWGCGCLLPLILLPLLLFLLLSGFGALGSITGKPLWTLPDWGLFNVPDYTAEIRRLENENALLEQELDRHVAMCVPEQPAAAPVAQAPEEELVIPENTVSTNFLEGEWRCETGLYSTKKNEPVKLIFSFGADGKGRGVTLEGNDQCAGAAQARMLQDILSISLDEQKCSQNPDSTYMAVTIECRPIPGGASSCEGVNQDGTRWDAKFIKTR